MVKRHGTSRARTGEGVGASGEQRKSSLPYTSNMLEVAWESLLCPDTSTKAQLLSQISSKKQQNNPAPHAKLAQPVMGLRAAETHHVTATMIAEMEFLISLQMGE